MEIGLREILMSMTIIVIAIIAIDVYKRLRQHRYALKFKLEPIDETLDDPLESELGTPRKAHRDPAQHARFDTIEQAYEDIERPQFQQLNSQSQQSKTTAIKPSPSNAIQETEHSSSYAPVEPTQLEQTSESFQAEKIHTEKLHIDKPHSDKPHSSSVSSPRVVSEATKAAVQQRIANRNQSRHRSYASELKVETKQVQNAPADVVILNIMALAHHHFTGEAIINAALMCGLRYGENQIFHFYEPSAATSSITALKSSTKKENSIFSLVNIIKPGIFDLDNMQDFNTPGICLFMPIPGPGNTETSFQKMLMIAHKLANQLEGDLYDELHNPLTQKRLKQLHERVVQLGEAQHNLESTSVHELQSNSTARSHIGSR